jgi:hypothetical protein
LGVTARRRLIGRKNCILKAVIAPSPQALRTGYFYEDGTKYAAKSGRCAQIYIFAWNPIYGRDVVDHQNPDQWEFFVVPTKALPEQKTITLSKIKNIGAPSNPVKIKQLCETIESILAS